MEQLELFPKTHDDLIKEFSLKIINALPLTEGKTIKEHYRDVRENISETFMFTRYTDGTFSILDGTMVISTIITIVTADDYVTNVVFPKFFNQEEMRAIHLIQRDPNRLKVLVIK